MKMILEGCDRLGKDTLIDHIIDVQGYHLVIHCTKPKPLTVYYALAEKYKKQFEESPSEFKIQNPELFLYQSYSFATLAILMAESPKLNNIILNRSWIGEAIYADRYRGYDGEYVFQIEKHAKLNECEDLKLVLLTTSNWGIIDDDGESHDFSQREHEQEDFKKAVARSIIPNKIIIDIWNGTRRKTPAEMLSEIQQGN